MFEWPLDDLDEPTMQWKAAMGKHDLCHSSTLFIGSDPARVASFFNQVEVLYMSLKTYCKLQRLNLAPAVNRCGENEQLCLLKSLQGKSINVGGNARCDSPGHSAKYGTYHSVELTLNKVLAVELVQVNK